MRIKNPGGSIRGPEPAAVKGSFGVSVTVVATCRIVAGQANACAATTARGSTIVAEKPVVTYSRDPKSGATVQTIEF